MKRKRSFRYPVLSILCGLGTLLGAMPVLAQQAPVQSGGADARQPQLEERRQRGVLDEIVVTAQVREQSLMDVPVSVSAISGDKMFEAGISNVQDVQTYVPNLNMSETGIGTNIFIRGIGSGINPGFEQSVGMYFDGINYGRAQLARAPFLDLARVEVLRGPQNILFGKNAIAGAISLISERPTDEFEGKVSASYEPSHGESIVDVILSGPLTDSLGARLAVRKRDMDGYIENLTLGRDEPQRDELTVRTIFEWDATTDVTAMLKLEYGSFDVTGRQVEIITDEPAKDGTFEGRRYSEIMHRTQIPEGTGTLVDIESHPSVLNTQQDFRRSSNGDFSDNDTYNVTLSVDWFRDDHTFTFTSAFLGYDFDELCDCDFTGAEIFNLRQEERYRQYSQEIRWVSPVGGTWEFIGGAYAQYSELEFSDSIGIPSDILVQLINADDLQSGGERGDAPIDGVMGGFVAVAGDAGDELRGLSSPRDYANESTALSVFLQGTWNMAPRWRLNLGGRLSYDRKKGSRSLDFFNQEGQPDQMYTVVAKNFSAERHDLSGSRSETVFMPEIGLEHDLTDHILLYATANMGFKAGGFDARSNQSPELKDPAPHNPNYNETFLGAFEFEEEEAISIELGSKMDFLQGAGELSVAGFYTEYDDLQVSIFDGTLGFNVRNAGAARVWGVEMDGRMALSESLMLVGSLAWLDFEFTDFEDGQCYQDQEIREPHRVTDEERGLCSFTGKTNQFVADYTGMLSLLYRRHFGESFEFRGNIDVAFRGDYNPSQDLDPDVEQSGYVKLNGRISLADIQAGWEVALVGENLTDEAIISFANPTPLSNSVFRSKGHYAFIERPRNVALQAIYRWP